MPQNNFCFWGDTRAGKTKKVLDMEGDENVFLVQVEDGRLWFDHYAGQKVLLIDEFAGDVPINVLKSMLDNYQRRCHIKGGFVYKQWDTVYITSNQHPQDWYPMASIEDLMALGERFDEVTYFENPEYKIKKVHWNNTKSGEKNSITFSPLPQKTLPSLFLRIIDGKKILPKKTSKARKRRKMAPAETGCRNGTEDSQTNRKGRR